MHPVGTTAGGGSAATMGLRVLILDDDPSVVTTLGRVVQRQGFEAVGAHSIAEAESLSNAFVPDVAVVDVYLQEEDGLQYVRELRSKDSAMGIVVISAEDTQSLAKKAIQSGADNFLSKPIAPAALSLTVRKLAELQQKREKIVDLERQLEHTVRDAIFPEIVTNSDAMKAVLRLVEKVAPRDLSVLICGESGTGKELIASAIHGRSPRREGNFVELNCAALPPNLVESELFGHEKGAFTGAVTARPGKIQQAAHGTLFLDEIGELPLEIQPKLLRALQEKRIVPIGGKRAIECDFRLISATNRDLVEEVQAGRFREDLFYRIAVFPIKLPPLRERLEDLDLLLAHFLRQEGVASPRIDAEARARLHTHQWPGNVRELRNFCQAIPLFIDEGVIEADSVERYFGTRLQPNGGPPDEGIARDLPGRPVRKLGDIEREEIAYALKYYTGNVSEAARALGMGRATLYKYIKRNDIELEPER